MEIKYVKHPVSPEDVAKLKAQGYRILDARFDPNPVPVVVKKTAKSKDKAD